MELSIIILSYNTKDLTLRCIKSIISQYATELQQNKVEVIVVDNASVDGSPSEISRLRRDFHLRGCFGGQVGGQANLKLIENKENYGFAKGCNIGAMSLNGKYLLFLNSDTEVLDKGFLKMVKFLDENPKIGILGGKLKNPDGSSQASAGKFYNLFNLTLMLLGLEKWLLRSSPNKVKRVDWVSGACFMARRDLFEKLKGFDEHFFMYVEDMELCYNASSLGFLTYFYPNVLVSHKELGSSNRGFAIVHIYKGILYFYKKHKAYWQYLLVKLLLFVKALVAILIGLLSGNSYLKDTYRKAIKFV